MISEKRFELAYEQGDWWAVRDGDITLWKEEVVDKLNEQQFLIQSLKEENEQLKQKLETLNLNAKNDSIKMIEGKFFIRM